MPLRHRVAASSAKLTCAPVGTWSQGGRKAGCEAGQYVGCASAFQRCSTPDLNLSPMLDLRGVSNTQRARVHGPLCPCSWADSVLLSGHMFWCFYNVELCGCVQRPGAVPLYHVAIVLRKSSEPSPRSGHYHSQQLRRGGWCSKQVLKAFSTDKTLGHIVQLTSETA